MSLAIFFSGPEDVIQASLDLPQLWRNRKNVQTQNFPLIKNRSHKTFRIFIVFE